MALTFEELKVALHTRSVVRRYPFPGKPDIYVGIKLLTEAEQDGVRLRAQQKVQRDKAMLIIDPDFFDRLVKRETVAQAVLQSDASDAPYLFEDAEQLAELDAYVVTALYELYLFHSNALDPYTFATEEEVNGLVEQLGKSETEAARLSLFGPDTLRSLCLSMASLLRAKSPGRSSSTG